MAKHRWWEMPVEILVDEAVKFAGERVKEYMHPTLTPFKELVEGAFAPVQWDNGAARVSATHAGRRVEIVVVEQNAQVILFGLTSVTLRGRPSPDQRAVMTVRNRETVAGTWELVPVNGTLILRCTASRASTGLTSSEIASAAQELAQEVATYQHCLV